MLEENNQSLSAIELADKLSNSINNTINPTYIALNSFEDLIEPDTICILTEAE